MAPKIIDRFQKAVAAFLADGGERSSAKDKTMVAKTSPTVWEYEMFRMEWTRRAVLRALLEMLQEDTRLRRANHVFAATGVRRGFDLKVTSSVAPDIAKKAQKVLEDFMRRIKLNSKLAPWARVLLRDGDLFLNPIVDFKRGQIVQVKSLPALTMQRNDDITGNFPDRKKAFQQIDPITLQPEIELAIWQVNHIRWSYEEGQRYGRSQYLGCLRTWKQLSMMEQDLVIRRRTRAAPKRVHILGDKDHPGNDDDIQEYMERNKLDGSTRDIVSDFFINGLGDVKDLNPDAMLDHIKDIIYQQEVYMIGSGVPLHILGFGQNVNRDIISDQKAQFEEDVQELRNLLESGDSGAYSGIRSLFDLELVLHDIDPSLLDYNIVWFENNNETANDRVNRVIQLRSSQPTPLISQRTALRVIAKDLGFDNMTAIEEEIDNIKDEYSQIAQMQQVQKGAPNPEVPMEAPLSKEISRGAGHFTQDSQGNWYVAVDSFPALKSMLDAASEEREDEGVDESGNTPLHETGNDISFPLHHNPQLNEMESHLRERISNSISALGTSFISSHSALVARLGNTNPSWQPTLDTVMVELNPYTLQLLTDSESDNEDTNTQLEISSRILPILSEFEAMAKEQAPEMTKDLYDMYMKVGEMARKIVHEQLPNHQGLAPRNISQTIQQHLHSEAQERVGEILNTTKNLLAKELQEGMSRNETEEQLLNRVRSVLNMPAWRANTIGRTEIAHAYGTNIRHIYGELGVQFVRRRAIIDNRTCSPCASLNNTVYAIDSLPEIQLHPNCRCWIEPAGANDE